MIYNNAIHVQVEEGRENGNVEAISTPEVDDYLYEVHDV
jgi:hypothetical protein